MAPSKQNKAEINPWAWVSKVKPEDVKLEHILSAYRVTGYKPCDDQRRPCRKNPHCLWGLGEKKWVQDADEEADDDDDGFRSEGEFAGLQNLGATCYVNSLLQLWFHNPIIRPAILKWQPTPEEDAEDYKPKCAIGQLQAMFARMKVSKRSKIDPTEFVTSLQLDTGEQQDAQEFSKLFMDVIVNLLREYGDAGVRNSVLHAFRGKLQNETECLGCHNKTQRQETFSELELSVRKNLSLSIDELLKDETLNESNQYFCSNCQKKQDAIRRTQLLRLPPILNLQLMRFVFDRETYRKKKVTTNILFPEVLDMSSRVITNPSEGEGAEKKDLIYHLTAVLIHNGPSASSGHYVAQIRDVSTGVWLKFNDENVDKVGKVKSKKLILKDDEDDSEEERKGKSGKRKPSAGNHMSPGAYMLVYTLEDYVQNPQPDPKLWPFLENLVNKEDQAFEDELKKSRNNKNYEIELKEQRKQQIKLLYPSLNLEPKPVAAPTSSGGASNDEVEEEDGPPKKMARSEVAIPNGKGSRVKTEPKSRTASASESTNGDMEVVENLDDSDVAIISVKTKRLKNLHSNGEVAKVPNGVEIKSNSPETVVNYDDKLAVDFIPTEWLQMWLDVDNPPPPIDSGILKCPHGKLCPPAPSSQSGLTPACLYRIVPSKAADFLYESYDYTGTRFRGIDSFCSDCVKTECGRLRELQTLEEDYRTFQDLLKKSDSQVSQFSKAGLDMVEEGVLEGYCWAAKDTIKRWKRRAKNIIELKHLRKDKNGQPTSEAADRECDRETMEDSQSDNHGPTNSEVLCIHDKLCNDDTVRKLISIEAFSLISKYFSDAILLSGMEITPCSQCALSKEEESAKIKKNKEIATYQKTVLNDLYSCRGRPSGEKVGVMYAIPRRFFNLWKKFIRDPAKNSQVTAIDNKTLLCKHDRFMYPLPWQDEEDGEESIVCLVTKEEWTFFKKNFEVDQEIKIEILKPLEGFSDGASYTPDVCNTCYLEWYQKIHQEKFKYESAPLYVYRREADNNCESDDDDLFEPVVLPASSSVALLGKRERKPRSDWQNPPWSNKDEDSQGIRRSNRSRRQKGQKSYKVSSDLTIKELKVMILKDFTAIPSDQHLFFNDKELSDSMTLEACEIPPKASLFLEIDTVSKTEDEPVSATPEIGFQGTLLMGRDQMIDVGMTDVSRSPLSSSMN